MQPYQSSLGLISTAKPKNHHIILRKFTCFIAFLISFQLAAQDKHAKGYILNTVTDKPVANAKITEVTNGNHVYSDSSGFFEIDIPKRNREFLVTHDDYKPMIQRLHPHQSLSNLIFKITPYNFNLIDTAWRSYKNTIMLAPFELINGAVALRYERFLKPKHSIGLHTSVYLFGFNSYVFDLGYYSASFKGIKLTPFYRYYPVRSNYHGFFLEGKISYGYIHFSELTYEYAGYYKKRLEVSFSTFGATIAIGWMFRIPKSKHGVGNFSIGLQSFPFNGSTSVQAPRADGTMVTWTTNPYWWYIWSPGAVLEFKFTIGGIF